jgi:hypothetical protein
MATTLINPAAGFATYALQARTDAAGDPVDDVTGEDLRLLASLFTEGVVGGDAFRVSERGAGANMSVDVGSGSAENDLAVVAGTASGQGNYVVRLGDAVTNVSVNASNVSNPRIDEIYLVVQDDQYDASGRVIARLAYRDGTPGATPAAPGPDSNWDAYLLLAQVLVGAGVTSIVDANITDQRAITSPVPHAASHHQTGDDPLMVMGHQTTDNGNAAMSGTAVNRAAVTFTKPASWRSYDIMAWGTALVVYQGENADAVGGLVRIGSSDGTELFPYWGYFSPNGNPSTPFAVAASHQVTGLTSSSVQVAIRTRESPATPGAFAVGATVAYVAVRRS